MIFYLVKGKTQIAAAEHYDRAARLVREGWELTTRSEYIRRWREKEQPLLEKERGN